MAIIDIILLVLLLICIVVGYSKGLLMELVYTCSFILGIFLGFKFWNAGAQYIKEHFDHTPQLLPILGFVLVFGIVLVGLRLIGKVVKMGMDQTIFGTLDKILGALLGAIKWLVGLSAFLWVAYRHPIASVERLVEKSVVCNTLSHYIPQFSSFLN